ncbi:MAG: hypothetical protein LQ348_007043 [Seirophora lacunosa]|nr:MAG: hypothetical protein LQ348_007043 [Seirophora lacunosa]
MSLPDPSGFAVRRNGTCLSNEIDCGRTAAPFRACCPARASCPEQYNIDCCPSPANCTSTLLQEPACANTTWTLYDNQGYFCCAPGTIGYNATETFSSGCAIPGSPPRGAELLAVVSAGETGGVLGGVAATLIAAIVAFWFFRKRKNKSDQGPSRNRPTSFHELDTPTPNAKPNEVDGKAVPNEVDGMALSELPASRKPAPIGELP